jgi:hypothetical protein
MFVLKFLPEWFFHLILLVGIFGMLASLILKSIPFIKSYALPIQLFSGFLLVLGIFFQGAMSNEASWISKVKEMELKVAEAAAKSAEANQKIETVYVDRVQVVKEIKYVVQNNIKTNSDTINKFCVIGPEVISILNTSASNVNVGDKK